MAAGVAPTPADGGGGAAGAWNKRVNSPAGVPPAAAGVGGATAAGITGALNTVVASKSADFAGAGFSSALGAGGGTVAADGLLKSEAANIRVNSPAAGAAAGGGVAGGGGGVAAGVEAARNAPVLNAPVLNAPVAVASDAGGGAAVLAVAAGGGGGADGLTGA